MNVIILFSDYDEKQQSMYFTMSELIEDAVYNLKIVSYEFDMRFLPCWHDYRSSGFEMVYKYPDEDQ